MQVRNRNMDNEQQTKQFNAVATFVNEAIKNNMPVFMKLVQMDVLKSIQDKAVADKVANTQKCK